MRLNIELVSLAYTSLCDDLISTMTQPQNVEFWLEYQKSGKEKPYSPTASDSEKAVILARQKYCNESILNPIIQLLPTDVREDLAKTRMIELDSNSISIDAFMTKELNPLIVISSGVFKLLHIYAFYLLTAQAMMGRTGELDERHVEKAKLAGDFFSKGLNFIADTLKGKDTPPPELPPITFNEIFIPLWQMFCQLLQVFLIQHELAHFHSGHFGNKPSPKMEANLQEFLKGKISSSSDYAYFLNHNQEGNVDWMAVPWYMDYLASMQMQNDTFPCLPLHLLIIYKILQQVFLPSDLMSELFMSARFIDLFDLLVDLKHDGISNAATQANMISHIIADEQFPILDHTKFHPAFTPSLLQSWKKFWQQIPTDKVKRPTKIYGVNNNDFPSKEQQEGDVKKIE